MTDGRWRSQGDAGGGAEPTDEDLAVLFDMSNEVFGVFAADGTLEWWGTGAATALGYDDEEFSGLDPDELVHPDDAPVVRRFALSTAAGSAPARATARYRGADGSWRAFEWTARVEPGTGAVVGVALDVTERRRARTELATSETRLQAIVDHSTAAVSVKDLGGRYLLVNDAFVRLFAFARGDVIGKTAAELWPTSSPRSDERDALVLRQGTGHVSDEVLHLADGPHTLMTVRFSLRDDDGAAVGIAAIATDITERKRAEVTLAQRDRLLDTIVRASPDIVVVLDAAATVTEISEAATSILGATPGLGRLDQILHPDDVAAVNRALAAVLSRRIDHVDLRCRLRRGDGGWATFDTHAEAVVADDGQATGAVAVLRDVTADLEIEDQLRAAVGAAEQASAAKSAFLSRMSHELRTPLNSVLGFAQLLEMDELAGDQAEAVGHILRAGRHLLDLIDEVLDIARIESGRLDLSVDRVRLGDVVHDAMDLTRPLSERCGVSVSVAFDATSSSHVAADRQRLLQVLLNLLSNAVKYNHRGGTVEVAAAPVHGDRVAISVTDSGRGIASEDLPRLFDPFDRLGAENTGVQGSGVGLTLTKHLVEGMGGELTVRSEAGAGSVFTVTLGAVEPPRAPAPTSAPPSPAVVAGRLRVLHVEDNVANLELVEQVLARRADVELHSAMDGALGLELARRHRPDLILLDLHLPDMLGTEVFDRLRSEPATAAIPVVVVSADATPTQVERLRDAGVAAYLTKPIDVGTLLEVVALVAAGEPVP